MIKKFETNVDYGLLVVSECSYPGRIKKPLNNCTSYCYIKKNNSVGKCFSP